MGFKTAVIAIKAASVGTGIKAMLRKQKADAKLTISLSERIGNELGWRDGDKLEVLIGDAEHHGLLRLRKNNSVGVATVSHRKTTRGGWLAIPLGHQSVFVNRAEGGRWCQWEKVEDGWIEVVLPAWADETRTQRSARSAPSSSPPSSPVRRGASVTAGLMGDPEPGRREAVARIK